MQQAAPHPLISALKDVGTRLSNGVARSARHGAELTHQLVSRGQRVPSRDAAESRGRAGDPPSAAGSQLPRPEHGSRDCEDSVLVRPGESDRPGCIAAAARVGVPTSRSGTAERCERGRSDRSTAATSVGSVSWISCGAGSGSARLREGSSRPQVRRQEHNASCFAGLGVVFAVDSDPAGPGQVPMDCEAGSWAMDFRPRGCLRCKRPSS